MTKAEASRTVGVLAYSVRMASNMLVDASASYGSVLDEHSYNALFEVTEALTRLAFKLRRLELQLDAEAKEEP